MSTEREDRFGENGLAELILENEDDFLIQFQVGLTSFRPELRLKGSKSSLKVRQLEFRVDSTGIDPNRILNKVAENIPTC
jgi:hypothetical protein